VSVRGYVPKGYQVSRRYGRREKKEVTKPLVRAIKAMEVTNLERKKQSSRQKLREGEEVTKRRHEENGKKGRRGKPKKTTQTY